MDIMTASDRSYRMRLIRSRDTKPELCVRRLVHSLGYRYRLHMSWLPGRPDLAFTRRRKVVFVHGCFWHGHVDCRLHRFPKSRRDYWGPKIEGNRDRDERNRDKLLEAGWKVLVIWECELRDMHRVEEEASSFLGPPRCGTEHDRQD